VMNDAQLAEDVREEIGNARDMAQVTDSWTKLLAPNAVPKGRPNPKLQMTHPPHGLQSVCKWSGP